MIINNINELSKLLRQYQDETKSKLEEFILKYPDSIITCKTNEIALSTLHEHGIYFSESFLDYLKEFPITIGSDFLLYD